MTGAGRPSTDRPVSASVVRRLTGLDLVRFTRDHWGRAPSLVRGADPGGFADLLDLDGVDDLLSRRGLRTPFLRMARDGTVVSSASFTGPGGAGAEIGDQVRDDRVAALFADGTTIVLQALHRTWPPVIDLVTELGAELGLPVQANAYVTPASSRGFDAHYDVHDVFVLQLAGRKHWTVHAPVHPDPLRSQPWTDRRPAVAARAADDEPALDIVLEPGDVMYLPRGWLHSATALGELSAHLTIGVHVVTAYALVEALTAAVAVDPTLRTALPPGLDVADPQALAPHLDAVRAELHAALDRIDVDDVARRVRGRVWDGQRVEPVRPLAAAAFRDGIRAGDLVRVRLGLGHRVVERGAEVVVELPDRRIAMPAVAGAAVRMLLAGGPVAVGTAPGLDEADQLALVRRLLIEGVLVPAGDRGDVPPVAERG